MDINLKINQSASFVLLNNILTSVNVWRAFKILLRIGIVYLSTVDIFGVPKTSPKIESYVRKAGEKIILNYSSFPDMVFYTVGQDRVRVLHNRYIFEFIVNICPYTNFTRIMNEFIRQLRNDNYLFLDENKFFSLRMRVGIVNP